MKKILKILGITVFVLLLVIIISPFFLKGKVVGLVKQEINKSVNADVEFNDDISLGLIGSFPDLRLSIEDISVVGRDTFKNDTLISASRISLDMNLMSVISGHIKINEVVLNDPKANLIILKDGTANYDIAIQGEETTPDSSIEGEFNLNLDKLEINNAVINYMDLSSGMELNLKEFNHSSSGKFNSKKFAMNTKTDAKSLDFSYHGVPYMSNVGLDILANIGIDLEEMKFEILKNEIKLNELMLISKGWYQVADDFHNMDLSLDAPQVAFDQILSLFTKNALQDIESIKTKGKVEFNALVKGKMGNDLLPSFKFIMNIMDASLKYPDLPKDIHDIQMGLKIHSPGGSPNNTIVDLNNLHANIGGHIMDAKMLLKTPISDPFMDVVLKGDVDLTDLHNSIKLDNSSLQGNLTADIEAKGNYSHIENENYDKLSANGLLKLTDFIYKDGENGGDAEVKTMELSFSNKEVKLIDLTGHYGESDFKASGQLEHFYGYAFGDETLMGNLNLESNYLNLNHYLSDEELTENSDPQPEDTVLLEAIDIPENLNLSLNSSIGKLIYDNLKMKNVIGKMTIVDKKLIFNEVSAGMFGGSMKLSGVYDSRVPEMPFTDVSLSANQFNIKESFKYLEVVRTLGPVAEFVDGVLTAELNLKSNLDNNLSPDYGSLSGDGKLVVTEGVVNNLKILNDIGSKLNMSSLKKLSVRDLMVNFKIEDGKIHLQDTMNLPVGTNVLKVLGYTKIDQSINYKGLINVPRSQLGAGNNLLTSLTKSASSKGLNLDLAETIPMSINIGGFVQKPTVKFSLNEAKTSLLGGIKKQLTDKKDEVVDDLKEKKQDAQKRALDSLNRTKEEQKRKILAEARKQADQTIKLSKLSADKVRKEGNANADKIIKEAKGKNLILRKAAEKSANSVRSNANKKATSIEKEGQKKAQGIMDVANKKVAKL